MWELDNVTAQKKKRNLKKMKSQKKWNLKKMKSQTKWNLKKRKKSQKKWNLKKNKISKKKCNLKKSEISKKIKSKQISKLRNFKTQKTSGSDNVSVRQCQGQIMSGSS